MNVHSVMQYNGYTGGRMLLIVNASLTKEMVTNCALVMRNDIPNVTAMVSVTGVMTWVVKVLPFLWCPAASAIRVLSTGGCVRNGLDVTQSRGAHGTIQTGISLP